MFAGFGPSIAQEWQCGNENTTLPEGILKEYLSASEREIQRNPYSTDILPIKFHIVQPNSGSGGYPASQLNTIINILNDYFYWVDIQFEQCGEPNYIANSALYDFNTNDIGYINGNFNFDNTVNIYLVNSLFAAGAGYLGGIGMFPWQSEELIVVTNNDAPTPLIAHEMGHFLGLLHTHETANGYEFVNGSNCGVAGDLICDTPADPNLSGWTSNCQYVGSFTDPLGWYYQPDPGNVMSYNIAWCLTHFSNQQISVMNYYYDNTYSNFQCNTGGNNGSDISLYAPISYSPNPIDCDGPLSIYTNFINTGNSTFYGDFAAVLFDAGGNFTEVALINTGPEGLQAGYVYNNNLEFSSTGLNLSPGTYSLGMFYTPTGGSPIAVNPGNYQNFIDVPVSCGGGNDAAQICISSNIQVNPNPLISNGPVSVTYQVRNQGSQPFAGTFSADYHNAGNGEWLDYIEELSGVVVCGGCTQNLTFSSSNVPLTPGNYQITAWLQPNGGNWSVVDGCNFGNTVSISVVGSGTTSTESIDVEEKRVSCYPNPVKNMLTIDIPHEAYTKASLEIYNASGQLVHAITAIDKPLLHLNVQDWASGLYLYRFVLEEKAESGRFSVVK
jgi:hypothetical protein